MIPRLFDDFVEASLMVPCSLLPPGMHQLLQPAAVGMVLQLSQGHQPLCQVHTPCLP